MILRSPQCLDEVKVSELVKLHKCLEHLDVKVIPAEGGAHVSHLRAPHTHTQQICGDSFFCSPYAAAQTPEAAVSAEPGSRKSLVWSFRGLISADSSLD